MARSTVMLEAIETYLALRRATGFAMSNAEYLLKSFAGIRPSPARRPRLHDLRNTFAVRALQDSPTGQNRCGAHMVALATYMGHVNIYATYWYLEATADLVGDIAMAGDAFMSEGKRA